MNEINCVQTPGVRSESFAVDNDRRNNVCQVLWRVPPAVRDIWQRGVWNHKILID